MLNSNGLCCGNVRIILAGIDLYLSVLDLNKGGNGAVHLAVCRSGGNKEQIVAGIQLQSCFALAICGFLRKYRREIVALARHVVLQYALLHAHDIIADKCVQLAGIDL